MDRKDWDFPKTPAMRSVGLEFLVAALHDRPELWSQWIRAIVGVSEIYCYECKGKGQIDSVSCDLCEGTGDALTDLGESLVSGLMFLERLQQRIKFRRSKNNRN